MEKKTHCTTHEIAKVRFCDLESFGTFMCVFALYGSLSLIEKGKTKLGRIGLVRFT